VSSWIELASEGVKPKEKTFFSPFAIFPASQITMYGF
jgi:hypothetical protein